MATQDWLTDMKTTILELIEDLKDNVFTSQAEIGDLILVEFFFKRMHPERIMNHIISKVLPWKKKIHDRDQKFFLENTSLFVGLPKDRIQHYSSMINNLTGEDKKTIWLYFDTVIAIAENYRKTK